MQAVDLENRDHLSEDSPDHIYEAAFSGIPAEPAPHGRYRRPTTARICWDAPPCVQIGQPDPGARTRFGPSRGDRRQPSLPPLEASCGHALRTPAPPRTCPDAAWCPDAASRRVRLSPGATCRSVPGRVQRSPLHRGIRGRKNHFRGRRCPWLLGWRASDGPAHTAAHSSTTASQKRYVPFLSGCTANARSKTRVNDHDCESRTIAVNYCPTRGP